MTLSHVVYPILPQIKRLDAVIPSLQQSRQSEKNWYH